MKSDLKRIVKNAIKEDVGTGDITTRHVVDPKIRVKAKVVAQEDLVLCGLKVCKEVFKQIDPKAVFRPLKKEGSLVKKKAAIASIEARASSVLKAERVALNFLMHLSGISSCVRELVEVAKRYKVKILDTRKTTPGLRQLQKYAVVVGGGYNHRKGLWDAFLIKENHLISSKIKTKSGLRQDCLCNIIKNIKKATGEKVEVEVENLREYKTALQCKPDIILLDNFKLKDVSKAVRFRNKYCPHIALEASGGISHKNIASFSKTGIEYISLGILTHSPRAKDISLDIV